MRQWGDNVSVRQIEEVTRAALAQGVIANDDRAVVFHDMTLLRSRLHYLDKRFPPSSLHAVAIKANPVVGVLCEIVGCGLGLEAASLEEAYLALSAGCPPQHIVFDSPAKTMRELEDALTRGFVVNANSFEELERIGELYTSTGSSSLVGLRINPMVGAGTIGITSVAEASSKFGVRIDTERNRILESFVRYDWLTGLHVHVGSQGCGLDLLTRAVREIETLFAEVEQALGSRRFTFVDIGGGLPVKYTAADAPPSLDEFYTALTAAAPRFLNGEVRLITEFGRAIHSGCGFAVSQVEYVKTFADHEIAIIHLGADMLMRPVYLPDQWKHRFLVLDQQGRVKQGSGHRYTIGGPLCFAGDLVARDLDLPCIEPGDFLVVRDTGAYTLSMWSRHCSRGLPKVVGFEEEEDRAFRTLLPRETPFDVAKFWGARNNSFL